MHPETLEDFVPRCILKISGFHEEKREDLKSLQDRCRHLAYKIPFRHGIANPVASDSSSQRVRLHHSIPNVALCLTDASMEGLRNDIASMKSVVDDRNADPNDICVSALVLAQIEINNQNYSDAESLACRVITFTKVLPLIIYESYSLRIHNSNAVAFAGRGCDIDLDRIPKNGFRIEEVEALYEHALQNALIEQFHFQILLKRASYYAWNGMYSEAIADLDKVLYDFDVNYLSSYRFIVLNAVHARSAILRDMNRDTEAHEWEQFYLSEFNALQVYVPKNADRYFWKRGLDLIRPRGIG